MPLILRIRLWFVEQRIAVLRDDVEYHRSAAISMTNEADELQRLHLKARLQHELRRVRAARVAA